MQQDVIDRITDQLLSQDIDEHTLQSLRKAYHDIHFTFCMDDDIYNGKPVKETEKFNVYLVNSSSTCLSLTNDVDRATGLVIAEVIPDTDD